MGKLSGAAVQGDRDKRGSRKDGCTEEMKVDKAVQEGKAGESGLIRTKQAASCDSTPLA